MMGALGGFIGVLSIFAVGDLLRSAFGFDGSRFRVLALSWLLGAISATWLVFILLWIGVPLRLSVFGLSVLGLTAWALVRGRRLAALPRVSTPWLAGRSWIGRSLSLLIFVQLAVVVAAALFLPVTAWDAWVNWASRARVLIIDQTLSGGLHNDPSRLPTNLDYPLLLPLLEGWLFTLAGRIHDLWIGVVSSLYAVTLAALFFDGARRIASLSAALLGAAALVWTPGFDLLAASGLADVPFAAMLMACLLLLDGAADSPDSGLLIGCGLLAGGLAWLKNEGWLWLMLLTAVVVVRALRRPPRSIAWWRQPALFFGAALLVAAPWQLFLAIHGTHRINFLSPTPSNIWQGLPRLPEIVVEVTRVLLSPHWYFVWPAVVVLLMWRRGAALRSPAGWVAVPVVGYLLLVAASYSLSAFDPWSEHLQNSFARLVWHGYPVALWWLIGQARALGVAGEPA